MKHLYKAYFSIDNESQLIGYFEEAKQAVLDGCDYFTEKGLAEYIYEDDHLDMVDSITMDLELFNESPVFVASIVTHRNLTDNDIENLSQYMTAQMYDGWGEDGFEAIIGGDPEEKVFFRCSAFMFMFNKER